MRTHYADSIDNTLIGQTVTVCGWVQTYRDHGGVIFIDVRDETGLVQLVAAPENKPLFAAAEQLRSEYVVRATGQVAARPDGTVNPQLTSGAVEIMLSSLTVENTVSLLPFLPDDETSEETRLRYRVLNLRGGNMQKNIRLRHRLTQTARDWLHRKHFVEIETPILTRATPEGARDFLVPSRLQPGDCYALPQSPQLFKQMLVCAGFERYYQIARCFRDEDLRADRQPEFSQIDIEMAFVDEAVIMQQMEDFACSLFAAADVDLPRPFPRLTYSDAMTRFGTDRPDLRNPLELTELTALMRQEPFRVFSAAANKPDGRVAALRLPGGGSLTRRDIDELTALVGQHGASGLAYIKCQDIAAASLQSPIIKFLSPDGIRTILTETGAQNGDMLFFGAGNAAVVNTSLAALRDELARRQALCTGDWRPLWVVDFPLLAKDGEHWQALHHPFTATRQPLDAAFTPSETVLSRAYDMVMNGSEIGGGSIRIHRADEQLKILSILGIDEETARSQFGFLLAALETGAPPHGGIAFGLDRIAAMLCGADSIRDVIAFPKTQRGQCLLTSAPAAVEDSQLAEVGMQKRRGGKP